MIATITLQFAYNPEDEARPDKWDWRTLIDTNSNVRIKEFAEFEGYPCYFCADPVFVDDAVWVDVAVFETPTASPFHIGCAPYASSLG